MTRTVNISLRMMLMMTVLCGLAYPDLVTGLAQHFYENAADGSLVVKDGRAIGSSLAGQNFARPEYFHPRPSAVNYDASNSGGSNLGPTSQALVDRVRADAAKFREENPEYDGPIPADLLTVSGSGLDPDISPAAALAQTARVARARGVSVSEVEQLVREHVEPRQLGFLGEPRVNVL